MSPHFHFLRANDAGHCTLGIRNKGGAVYAHVCASSHFFLAIYAEFLHEFEFCVAEKWKRKIVFFNELVVRFRILCAANITSKQKSDMTKVAIKNENITSFGGIYIISLWFFILPHWFGWGISCLCKNQEPRKIPISMDKSQKCHFNI